MLSPEQIDQVRRGAEWGITEERLAWYFRVDAEEIYQVLQRVGAYGSDGSDCRVV